MSKDWALDVQQFIDKFHQDTQPTPCWPNQETINLRASLIKEEYQELTDAWMRRDLPETTDAILDLIYVLIGTLPALGIDPYPIWDAIHSANMAKEGGGRRGDGKIMKPPGWFPPYIKGLLQDQGYEGYGFNGGDE